MQSNHPVLSFQSIILFQNKFNAHTQILYWFQLICHTYKVFHSLTKTSFFPPHAVSSTKSQQHSKRSGWRLHQFGFHCRANEFKMSKYHSSSSFCLVEEASASISIWREQTFPPPTSNVFCPCFSDEEVKTGYPVRTANNPYSPTKYRRPFQYEHVFQQ